MSKIMRLGFPRMAEKTLDILRFSFVADGSMEVPLKGNRCLITGKETSESENGGATVEVSDRTPAFPGCPRSRTEAFSVLFQGPRDMWNPLVGRFVSVVGPNDETGSGKWLVPVPFGDPDGLWVRISAAASEGVLPGAKLSSLRLDGILGHHLVCAYCPLSNREAVAVVLATLRGLGATGDLEYKSDRATLLGRDEKLWHSADIETPKPLHP
jgi:hypothetical protein